MGTGNGVPKADAYGGVLVSRGRKVLLVEPKGHFGGYRWTFPKGRPDRGEEPVACALREVREEAGWRAEVLEAIPRTFPGTTTTTAYFVMGPVGKQGRWDAETASTAWVDPEEARRRIALTAHAAGRARDLAVLAAAEAFLDRGDWARRPACCKDDWRVKPLPRKRAILTLDRLYDARAALRIRKGWYPAAMEEKWFTWWEEPVLHMHRSWTGFCNFRVTFRPEGRGLRAVSALANRNPDQYTETDDAEDARHLLAVMDHLFVEAPDGPGVDHFVQAALAAAQPNYLGSPKVVGPLLGEIVATAIARRQRTVSYGACLAANKRVTAAFTHDPAYARLPGWHSREELGRHLIRRFALDEAWHAGENLAFTVSEALAALSLQVGVLLDGFEADPAAEWERDALPRLRDLHAWAMRVFLGLDVLEEPQRRLPDFVWSPIEA
jgi:8-oxo-dGTP pyrophosphatase MutT (NUDIX family)